MKLQLIFIGVLLSVIGVVTYMAMTKCDQPDLLTTENFMMDCIFVELQRGEELRERICIEVKGHPNCQFTKEDEKAVDLAIKKIINQCTKEKLEAVNLCTDKVDWL